MSSAKMVAINLRFYILYYKLHGHQIDWLGVRQGHIVMYNNPRVLSKIANLWEKTKETK